MGLFDDPGSIDWGMLASGEPTPAMQPDFAQRFKGAPIPPPIAPPMAAAPLQSPISPEALAATAAARGIPPPAKDLTPPVINPTEPFRMPDAAAVAAERAGGASDVGAALTGKGPVAPMDITSDAQKAGEATPKETDKMGDFAKALRGVKMPAGPELQKISSPSIPRPTTQIKGGELMAILEALNSAPGAGGLKLPSTLGQALGTK